MPSTCDDFKATCVDAWDLTLKTTTPGTYAVTLSFAGASTMVTCAVPSGPCTSSDDRIHGAVDATGIQLGTQRSPASVLVSVSRDGAAVLMTTFTPIYAPYYPNGSDCPPTCAGAENAVDVPLAGSRIVRDVVVPV